ncbi:hypothetical protein PtA15_10A375 [Puccinia triticina]|uniref:Uncharacterized protein n=1 Tax=Puccinia triticina TaxID=208348 RepID=A0ABY7CY71_9BASI|nr:uncharacterized protein PtA15_10A375 [Puccinia triticina]WAQ88952.1 hypothetical protein PtA15_10A375 [Puccinia triticina]
MDVGDLVDLSERSDVISDMIDVLDMADVFDGGGVIDRNESGHALGQFQGGTCNAKLMDDS